MLMCSTNAPDEQVKLDWLVRARRRPKKNLVTHYDNKKILRQQDHDKIAYETSEA